MSAVRMSDSALTQEEISSQPGMGHTSLGFKIRGH